MKKILRETLQQLEQEKEDNEKRENNLVLFNVPESTLETPKGRESEDLQVFNQFCAKGLRIELDENQIDKVIRIGKISNEDTPRPKQLKIVLKEKTDKVNIFRILRNLKEAEFNLQLISVSHVYSRQTREKTISMIDEAKKKDGDDSINYRDTIRGTATQLQVQKRRRKTDSNAANAAANEFGLKSINILLYNVRSLIELNKRIKFADYVYRLDFDVLLLTETWLTTDKNVQNCFFPIMILYEAKDQLNQTN